MTKHVSVRERIEEELDADRIHGLVVTRQNGNTVYAVVASSMTWDRVEGEDVDIDLPVIDVRTVVVDFEKDTVKVSDNGIWMPQGEGVAEGLTQVLGRTTTDLSGGTDPDVGPALKSAVEGVDPDLLLDREIDVDEAVEGQAVDRMQREPGIDPARSWGYGGGPPPEIERVVDRLEEAGLDPSEHFTRLQWGQKAPYSREHRYSPEGLTGNYGIELEPRDSGLVAIDVDYPEHFPDTELPETFAVSSPHGDDTQRHIILRCDEKERIAEHIGAWAVQSVEWGDLWIGDRYVVGPGSQLSEYACDDGEYTRTNLGGCSECSDPDGGYYTIVNDAPIATVDAETIIGLLDDSIDDETVLRNGRADNDPPESDDDQEDETDAPRCDNCGEIRDPEDLKELSVAGSTRRICRGGCDA